MDKPHAYAATCASHRLVLFSEGSTTGQQTWKCSVCGAEETRWPTASVGASKMDKPESDIVERLRDPLGPGSKLTPSGNKADPLLLEAADLITALRAKVDSLECHNLRNFELAQKNIKEVVRLEALAEKTRKEVAASITRMREADKTVEQRRRAEAAESELARIKAAMGEPVKPLLGVRLKLSFNKAGNCTTFYRSQAEELEGEWVWLIAATDGMNYPVFALPSENKEGEA